jgi:hypothetical protein
MAFTTFFPVDVLWSILVPQEPRNQSSPTEPHMDGSHTYDGVLSGAHKGPFATLLSPRQCHAAFCTMPHTLASVDQSPLRHPRTLPPSTIMDHKKSIGKNW